MSKPDNLLSGMSIALILALYRMLEVRPCRNRLPCFRQNAKDAAEITFNKFWQELTLNQQEEFSSRLFQCLYWRRLKCFLSFEHFLELWDKNLGLEEGFDKWRESLDFNDKDPLMLILRVLRRRRIPLSSSEVKYCLSALGQQKEEKVARIVYKLLLLGCYRVKIVLSGYSKNLFIRHTKDREDWNIFPSV